MLDFGDRVALVTGASRGIGASTALKLARCGVRVAINYYESTTEAEKLSKSIRSAGVDSIVLHVDVRDPVQVKTMIERTIKEFKKIDILVNNAGGLSRRIPVAESDDAHWNSIMDVNLRSVFNCCRAIIPHMIKANYGRIVNVSSIAASNGGGRYAVIYAASKAGQVGLIRSLAKEVATRGITVNCVSPGFIATEFIEDLSDKLRESYLSQIPMKRLGKTEEVAACVLFLASREASYVNGAVLEVTGGL